MEFARRTHSVHAKMYFKACSKAYYQLRHKKSIKFECILPPCWLSLYDLSSSRLPCWEEVVLCRYHLATELVLLDPFLFHLLHNLHVLEVLSMWFLTVIYKSVPACSHPMLSRFVMRPSHHIQTCKHAKRSLMHNRPFGILSWRAKPSL